jgi:hypothetical protein
MADAGPILKEIAASLEECGLEAILVGNAAAALQGAPVTTLDFDFMFRATPGNIKKMKKLAGMLEGVLLVPYYPASKMYRLVNDDRGLQLDFMPVLHGIKSFEGLKSRSVRVSLGGRSLLVADLEDVIRSKRALGRSKDLAVLEILEKTLNEKEKEK